MKFAVNVLRILLLALWSSFACAAGLLIAVFSFGRDDTVNRRFARILAWGGTRICGVKVHAENVERIEASQPCVYVTNHQSSLDVFHYSSIYPARTLVIAKKQILWVPVLGLYFWFAGNIMIDRANKNRAFDTLAGAVRAIRERKRSVWVFTEGTRNRVMDGELLSFKKGAFHMALQAQVPIVPIVSSRLDRILKRPGRMILGGEVRLRVLEPIPTAGLTLADLDRLIVDVRGRMQAAIHEISV